MTETAIQKRKPNAIEKLKQTINAESVQQQFKNALGEHADLFVASVIDLVASSKQLQECDPNLVIMECLKAATLKLPINRQLAFAYVIPYKIKGVMTPQFQMGYRGYIQLAMRTGWYKYLNGDAVKEGIKVEHDLLTGQLDFSGKPKGQKVQGYFAYLELTNGFSKSVYMPIDDVETHAKRYSKAYGSDLSPWKTDFDSMAIKTCFRRLLSRYGFLSVEMIGAVAEDIEDGETQIAQEITENANRSVIDITPETDETVQGKPDLPTRPKEDSDLEVERPKWKPKAPGGTDSEAERPEIDIDDLGF